MPLTFWRIFFVVAAIYNLSVGLLPMLSPTGDTAGLGYAQDPNTLLVVQMMSILIFVFGIGYLLVAMNPAANRGIVLIGVIGKSMVFVLLTMKFLDGTITSTPFLFGVADLLFVVAFVVFLLRARA